jgi:hypothetical protein
MRAVWNKTLGGRSCGSSAKTKSRVLVPCDESLFSDQPLSLQRRLHTSGRSVRYRTAASALSSNRTTFNHLLLAVYPDAVHPELILPGATGLQSRWHDLTRVLSSSDHSFARERSLTFISQLLTTCYPDGCIVDECGRPIRPMGAET